MKTLQESRDFLKRLKEEYGEVLSLIDRLKGKAPTVEPTLPTVDTMLPTVETTKVEPSSEEQAPIIKTPPPKPIKKSFSPIFIETPMDWMLFRMNAENLNELEKFFRSSDNAQSPKFLEIISQYKKELGKNLVKPADDEVDEETSYTFTEKLSNVIQRRFYTIINSCQSGKRNFASRNYYREIERYVRIYFERIGLKTFELRKYEPFANAQDHMEASDVPAPSMRFHMTIDEVIIQPRYFEYVQSDGQIEKFWIDGKCTVYKNSAR